MLDSKVYSSWTFNENIIVTQLCFLNKIILII